MAVAPVNTAATPTAGTTQDIASSALLTNYDTFLKMLTTQLRVQNPLEPMNAEKFTEQLVQYSAVEQAIQTNQKLEELLATSVSSATLSLVNYIGKTVEAAGEVTQLKNSAATWKLDASAPAKDATVTIRNSDGAIVYEGQMDLAQGENTFDWNGKLASGQTAPDGSYQISVTATAEDGSAVAINTRVTGVVTGIDTSGIEPYLKIGDTMVPLAALRSVSS